MELTMSLCGLLLLLTASFIHKGHCDCGDIPGFVNIKETDPKGTLLFNSTKAPGDTVMYTIGTSSLDSNYHIALKTGYLELLDKSTYVVFQLKKPLDLEAIYETMGAVYLTSISLTFDCEGTSHEFIVNNQEVNEQPLTFIGSPYTLNMSEAVTVGTRVFSFGNKVSDFDKPSDTNNYGFSKQHYAVGDFDGFQYFNVVFKSGDVILSSKIDYETLPESQKFYRLNITAKDRADRYAQSSTTQLTINILDADDQKPRFQYPGCDESCVAPRYDATVGLDEESKLDIHPAPIQAVDQDSLHANISYAFETANSMFTIDSRTAEVMQSMSVRESTLPDAEFRLVVRATKMTTNMLSDIAILNVKVRERNNGTIEPEYKTRITTKTDDGMLIPVIVLGVLLLLLIIAAVIVAIIVRRKHREAMVNPKDCEQEPATEEEDLGTDRSDHWNNGMSTSKEKLVLEGGAGGLAALAATPSGRGGQLPALPLKDSSTETDTPKRKKRSRLRKKHREPEVFDGTKEYNMGADREFFDSTDKSKVKRSHRSYDNKTDPLYWIKVPNDQPDKGPED